MDNKVRIEYDDDIIDIICNINNLLKTKGLWVYFVGKEHDGFEVIELKWLGEEQKEI